MITFELAELQNESILDLLEAIVKDDVLSSLDYDLKQNKKKELSLLNFV